MYGSHVFPCQSYDNIVFQYMGKLWVDRRKKCADVCDRASLIHGIWDMGGGEMGAGTLLNPSDLPILSLR